MELTGKIDCFTGNDRNLDDRGLYDDDRGLYDDDEWNSNDSDLEREEVECALYGQIYFQQDIKNQEYGSQYSVHTLNDVDTSHQVITGKESEPRGLKSSPSNNLDIIIISSQSSCGEECDLSDCSSSDIEMAFDEGMLPESEKFRNNLKFNVNEDQQLMLLNHKSPKADGKLEDNKNIWHIIDEDLAAEKTGCQRKRVQRYHDPAALSIRCFNCKEKGHMSHVCPKPHKSIICIHCGLTGHNFRDCGNKICYNCEKFGHIAKKCTFPAQKVNWNCYRCQMYGHKELTCSDIWRQFHMTTGRTLVRCAKKKNPNVWCYNCGRRGHFGFQCGKERLMTHTSPLYPFIGKYKEPSQISKHIVFDSNGKNQNGMEKNTTKPSKLSNKTEAVKPPTMKRSKNCSSQKEMANGLTMKPLRKCKNQKEIVKAPKMKPPKKFKTKKEMEEPPKKRKKNKTFSVPDQMMTKIKVDAKDCTENKKSKSKKKTKEKKMDRAKKKKCPKSEGYCETDLKFDGKLHSFEFRINNDDSSDTTRMPVSNMYTDENENYVQTRVNIPNLCDIKNGNVPQASRVERSVQFSKFEGDGNTVNLVIKTPFNSNTAQENKTETKLKRTITSDLTMGLNLDSSDGALENGGRKNKSLHDNMGTASDPICLSSPCSGNDLFNGLWKNIENDHFSVSSCEEGPTKTSTKSENRGRRKTVVKEWMEIQYCPYKNTRVRKKGHKAEETRK